MVANGIGIAGPERNVHKPSTIRTKDEQKSGQVRGKFGENKIRSLVTKSNVWKCLTENRKLDCRKLNECSVGETADGKAYAFSYIWPPSIQPSKERGQSRTEFNKIVKVDHEEGKKVEWQEPAGRKSILFGMFTVDESTTELIITEGEIDAIS